MLYVQYENNNFDKVAASFYGYLVGMVFTALLSILFQIRARSKNMEAYSYRQDFKYRRE